MDISKYSAFSVEEFLEDPAFRRWALNPTVEDRRFWDAFLQAFPEQKPNLEQARYLLLQMTEYFSAADQAGDTTDDVFRKVLRQTMEEAKLRKQKALRRRKMTRRLAVAASIALLSIAFSWLWFQPAERLHTYATGFGEWKTVELPDGSTVQLNANSAITLAETWRAGATRKVWLQGEAFFTVAKQPATKAKFQVETKDLTVEVYGTAFNVHSRGEQTNVFLQEGKVKLDLGDQEEFLAPGDFIAYSAKTKTITQRQKAPAQKHTSWKDGTLEDNATVDVILNKIKEIYGVDIIVENQEILSQEKKIAVPMDKIEIAIPILERTLGVQIQKKDNQLIIK